VSGFQIMPQIPATYYDHCSHQILPMGSSMTCFKFLDQGDVSKVLHDGTVVISSFQYFRELEEKEWGLISDRLEGASEMTTPSSFVLTENSRELNMLNSALVPVAPGIGKFVHIAEGGIVSMRGTRFVNTVPGHIYCASRGDFEALKIYHTQQAEKKYDACLRIKDFKELAERISGTGVLVETGRKFSDVFERSNIGVVEYEVRSRSVEQGAMIQASPFKKALVFKSQSEARIHFVPKNGEAPAARLIVKIDDPGSIFAEVSLR
jgi:hypothetical protein